MAIIRYWARFPAHYSYQFIKQLFYEVGTMCIPILQMRKFKHTKIIQLVSDKTWTETRQPGTRIKNLNSSWKLRVHLSIIGFANWQAVQLGFDSDGSSYNHKLFPPYYGFFPSPFLLITGACFLWVLACFHEVLSVKDSHQNQLISKTLLNLHVAGYRDQQRTQAEPIRIPLRGWNRLGERKPLLFWGCRCCGRH